MEAPWKQRYFESFLWVALSQALCAVLTHLIVTNLMRKGLLWFPYEGPEPQRDDQSWPVVPEDKCPSPSSVRDRRLSLPSSLLRCRIGFSCVLLLLTCFWKRLRNVDDVLLCKWFLKWPLVLGVFARRDCSVITATRCNNETAVQISGTHTWPGVTSLKIFF